MKQRTKSHKKLWIFIGILGTFIMSYGIIKVMISNQMTTIAEHHMLHAGMAVGAGLLAMALAEMLPRRDSERIWWSLPALIAPMAGMFLMWPSLYGYLMPRPFLHMLDHVGIALCTVLAVYAAQAYVRGLGWITVVLVVGMDAAAAGGFGVSPSAPPHMMDMPAMHSTTLLLPSREDGLRADNSRTMPSWIHEQTG